MARLNLTTVAIRSYRIELFYAVAEVFLVTVLPVLLLMSGLVPSQFRVATFVVCFLPVLWFIFWHELSLEELGFRYDNLGTAVWVFVPQAIMVAFVALIAIASISAGITVTSNVSAIMNPAQYLVISVPAQQLVYFGFLNARLQPFIKNNTNRAILIAMLFSAMHIPWKSVGFTVTTLVLGLWWGYLYTRKPNLFMSVISHLITGGVAMVAMQALS